MMWDSWTHFKICQWCEKMSRIAFLYFRLKNNHKSYYKTKNPGLDTATFFSLMNAMRPVKGILKLAHRLWGNLKFGRKRKKQNGKWLWSIYPLF